MTGVISCSSNTRGPPHVLHGWGSGGAWLVGHSGLPSKLQAQQKKKSKADGV
jgi:hypothetical protein